MFPIVPSHLTVRHHRSEATSSVSSSTDTATPTRHHPIWNMWNATLMDYKPSRSAKRSAKPQITSNTLHDAAGCVAATHLPRDAQSDHLQVMNRSSPKNETPTANKPLRIGLTARGVLRFEPDDDQSNIGAWITEIRLADDVHSNNVIAEVHRTENGQKELRVRIVRSIDSGDSLVLWFSEELLAMMNIPFLTPACIRGKNAYTCQTCEGTFENPNPLKIHMATNCSRRPQLDLWMRVEYSLNKDNLVTSATMATAIPFPIAPPSVSPPTMTTSPPSHHLPSWFIHHQYQLQNQQRSLLLQHQHQQHHQFLMLPESSSPIRPLYPPARLSAFQPVTTKNVSQSSSTSPSRTSSPMLPFSTPFSYPHLTPISSFQVLDPGHSVFAPPSHHHHLHTADHNEANTAAAHLETIVSNMGTGSPMKPGGSSGSGGGHLCIYCGKVYSRKYGLKIHIRTHTGFKPLKCKYCFRPFGDPSNLNKHVRLHVQGSTIYKCPEPQCDKILVRRRDLQRHMQTRHSTAIDGGDGEEGIRSECDDSSDVEGRSSKRQRCGSSSPSSSVASSSFEVHEDVLSTDEEDGHPIKVDQ